jgi:hypothetical protein
MKNNINNLISEELKKASLLFNYNTKKTLSENIQEQVNDAATSVLITKNPNDKAYDYMMKDGKYYFKGKAGTTYATKHPDWREAKVPRGINAIKALFDKNPKGDTPSENSNTGTSGTAGTAGTSGTAGTNGTTGTSGTAGTNGTPPTDNTKQYQEKFAQMSKDAQNLPKTIFGTQGGETPKQPNDGIVDDNAAANNTGQIQGTISDDEEL